MRLVIRCIWVDVASILLTSKFSCKIVNVPPLVIFRISPITWKFILRMLRIIFKIILMVSCIAIWPLHEVWPAAGRSGKPRTTFQPNGELEWYFLPSKTNVQLKYDFRTSPLPLTRFSNERPNWYEIFEGVVWQLDLNIYNGFSC